MTLWVVEMLRWGGRENHSYVEGVYDNYSKARAAAKEHEEWRGGKYEASINRLELNETNIQRFEKKKFLNQRSNND